MSNKEFKKDLATVINKHSKENGSDTPDWILAEYLCNCLLAFDHAYAGRGLWYAESVLKNDNDKV